MPLLPGKANRKQNFKELGQGKTYAHELATKGKAAADKQRVAIVLENERAHPEPKGLPRNRVGRPSLANGRMALDPEHEAPWASNPLKGPR